MKNNLRQVIKPLIQDKLIETYKQVNSIRKTAKILNKEYGWKKLKDLIDKKIYNNIKGLSGEEKIKFNKYHDVHNYLHEIEPLLLKNKIKNSRDWKDINTFQKVKNNITSFLKLITDKATI